MDFRGEEFYLERGRRPYLLNWPEGTYKLFSWKENLRMHTLMILGVVLYVFITYFLTLSDKMKVRHCEELS